MDPRSHDTQPTRNIIIRKFLRCTSIGDDFKIHNKSRRIGRKSMNIMFSGPSLGLNHINPTCPSNLNALPDIRGLFNITQTSFKRYRVATLSDASMTRSNLYKDMDRLKDFAILMDLLSIKTRKYIYIQAKPTIVISYVRIISMAFS
jgi:hypothetical protein